MKSADRLLFGLACLTTAAVTLICLPGLRDDIIARLPDALREAFGPFVWGIENPVTLPKSLLTLVLAPLLAGLSWHLQGHDTPKQQKLRRLAIFYVLWLAVSTAASILPLYGVESLLTQAAVALAALSLARALGRDDMHALLVWNAGVAALVAGYALCQHLQLDPLAWTPLRLVVARGIATLGNPDYLGCYLAVVFPIALMAVARSERGEWWAAATGIMLAALILTSTRAAWLATVVVLLLLAASWRTAELAAVPMKRWLVLALVASVLTGGVAARQQAVPGEPTAMSRLQQGVSGFNDYSASTRLALWREAVRVLVANPVIGTGPQTFSFAAMPYRADEPPAQKARMGLPGDPHNLWLEVAAASGVPAALALLALVLQGLMGTRDRFAQAALVAWMVSHCFLGTTVVDWWWLWLLLGAAGAESPAGKPEHERSWPLAAGLFVAFFLAWIGAFMLRANYLFNLGGQTAQALLLSGKSIDTAVLIGAVHQMDEARSMSLGPYRAALYDQRGKVLAQTYAHATPELLVRAVDFWNGMRNGAVQSFTAAIQINPFDPYYCNDLAGFFIESGRIDKSESARVFPLGLEASRQACKLDPYNAYLWNAHAVRCALADKADEAAQAFAHALELSPDAVFVRLDHAQFLLEQQQSEAAGAEVQRVLQLEPGNERAAAMLKNIQQMKNIHT